MVVRSAACLLALAALAARGQDRVQLNHIVSVTVDGGVVTVVGSRPPSFTTFTLAEPPRLVIDLSEAVLDSVPAAQPGSGLITEVRTASYGSHAAAIARILVAFERDVEPDITTDGASLTVRLPAAAVDREALLAERRRVEADRLAVEQARRAEAARLAEEERARVEAARVARLVEQQQEAERRKREEEAARQKAEEEKQARLLARREEEERKARLAEEARQKAEAEKQARLEAEREEARKKAQLAEEQRRRAEAEKQARLLAEKEEADRKHEEAEAARRKAEEERAARALAEQRAKEERLAALKAEQERKKQEAEAARRLADEERQARLEAERLARVAAQEAARAEAERVKREEAEVRRRAEEARLLAEREKLKAAEEARLLAGRQEPRAAEEARKRRQDELLLAAARTPAPGALAAGQAATMTFMGFTQRDGVGQISMRTTAPVRYSVGEDDEGVVVTLENTAMSLPASQRLLDTSFFDTAVSLVRPEALDDNRVRVIISLKRAVAYRARQDGNELTLEFARLE